MSGRKFDTEEIQEILWRYDKGCSLEEIRRLFRTSITTLKRILIGHDLVPISSKIQKTNNNKKKKPIITKRSKLLIEIDPFDGIINKGMNYRDYLKRLKK